jgi:peptidoglycan/xylan/chitin deacetylase (PgdA/CDA1 family)
MQPRTKDVSNPAKKRAFPVHTSNLLRGCLDLLFYSGAARLLSPLMSGIGALFMLHHVRPGGGMQKGFAPNSGLEITPEFLEQVIRHLRGKGYEILSMEDAVRRMKTGGHSDKPFAAFTIDDAYRDIFVHAWPVFRRHECPFTLFVAPSITDGTCELWWRALEAVIAGSSFLGVRLNGETIALTTVTDAQKQAAWKKLYWPLRRLEPNRQREIIRSLSFEHGIDPEAICRAEAMDWDDVRAMAKDPLCTIGAHTIHHHALAKLSVEDAMAEIVGSMTRIESEIGQWPRFLAYPYGDPLSAGEREFDLARAAGMEAAVTTRKGLIFPGHGEKLTALPRVSINGGFQQLRYLDVLLSGTAFALWAGVLPEETRPDQGRPLKDQDAAST